MQIIPYNFHTAVSLFVCNMSGIQIVLLIIPLIQLMKDALQTYRRASIQPLPQLRLTSNSTMGLTQRPAAL